MSLALRTRRNRLLAMRADIDGAGGGALWLLDGDMAPNPETAPANAPVCIVTLASVSFEMHATDAQMDLVPAVGNAARAGQPTWGRYVDGDGVAVYDCPAGPPGSGAEIIVTDGLDPPSAMMYTGGVVTVTHTITEP
ncbi:hypothetical protein ACVC7V_21545 [Hydrogenophaga sp. A37]|uniref:hypothetical protein n=1 Tax=Hydrogenophaga sp. A37 TaxID=1945864 RepID=UPI000985B8FD|nr:hypothetical protein [Hydrogenophaga sp. A37]OOG84244.1 hypothetical protein B0E41_10875 [Hydrogenophaga sp. A37]